MLSGILEDFPEDQPEGNGSPEDEANETVWPQDTADRDCCVPITKNATAKTTRAQRKYPPKAFESSAQRVTGTKIQGRLADGNEESGTANNFCKLTDDDICFAAKDFFQAVSRDFCRMVNLIRRRDSYGQDAARDSELGLKQVTAWAYVILFWFWAAIIFLGAIGYMLKMIWELAIIIFMFLVMMAFAKLGWYFFREHLSERPLGLKDVVQKLEF